jgi:acyl homoserine lactone synthase
MQTTSGRITDFSPAIADAIANYRHSIFVDRLGWDLPIKNGKENDQFDRDDTVYVIAKNKDGDVAGCARLLPTTSPYLLKDVFPELMNGTPIPSDKDIWELSRFSSSDISPLGTTMTRMEAALHTKNLLGSTVLTASQHGAKRIILVTSTAVERLLTRLKTNSHRVGPPIMIDNQLIVACWIEIDQKTCDALNVQDNKTTIEIKRNQMN